MINTIFTILGLLLGLFVLATIVLVIIQTIIEKYNDTDIKLNKKTETIITIALMVVIFLIGVFFDSSSQKRENKIKELINNSKSITELKEELLSEGIFEEI